MAVGLDIGTMNCVAARKDDDNIVFNTYRNCYIEIDKEDADNMSTESTNVVEINGRYFVIGEDAIKITKVLESVQKKAGLQKSDNKILERPMQNGVITSDEDSQAIMREIFRGILGEPKYPNEICCCSIPANTTSGINNIYHSGVMQNIISSLGYKVKSINEGLSIVYSENPTVTINNENANMTGIGISFGAGQVNFCFAFKKKPLITFSLQNSGDWVDDKVSKVRNMGISSVTMFKEKYLDFSKTYKDSLGMEKIGYSNEELNKLGIKNDREINRFRLLHEALYIYYQELITNVIDQFEEEFEANDSQDKKIDEPIEIVVSGGTSKPKGFVDLFTKILNSKFFPFDVRVVRLSSDPLNATSKGCLVAALSLEKKVNDNKFEKNVENKIVDNVVDENEKKIEDLLGE